MSIRQPIGDRRDHHALELPDRDPVLEDDAGARRRQHRRVQAARATRRTARRSLVELMDRGRLPGRASSTSSPGAGGEVGDAIVESPRRPGDLVHGPSVDGQVDRRAGGAAASSGSRSSSAARTPSSSCATPTSTSPTDGILWSAFGTTGQRCTACSRVIVERPVADEPLLERLEARAKRAPAGLGPRRGRRRRAAHQPAGGREGRRVHRDRAAEGGARDRRRGGDRRRPRARPLLPARRSSAA